MGMELRLQELVRLALVDQDLGRPRASPDELGRIVGRPGIAIRPEVVREGLLAPRAARGGADGRERRYGAETLRVPERGHERAVAAHGMSEYAEAPPVDGEIRRDQRRQLLRDVGVHAVAVAPGRLRCVDVKAGAEAEIPVGVVAGMAAVARARIRCNQGEPSGSGVGNGAGLRHEGVFVAGEAGEIEQGRYRAPIGGGRQIDREAHISADLARSVSVDPDTAAVAPVRALQSRLIRPKPGHQNSTTARIDLPSCIRSKPSLIRSSGSLWVMRSSMLIFPSMYQSTIFGTSVRPLAPPKAVPRHTRPVTSWKGRVAISRPASATPMMIDSPQPRWQHSSAWRMVWTLPMHSNEKSAPPPVTSTMASTTLSRPTSSGLMKCVMPNFSAMARLLEFTSTPTILLAPTIRAPWITLRPMPP